MGVLANRESQEFDLEVCIPKCRSFDSVGPEFGPNSLRMTAVFFIAKIRDRILVCGRCGIGAGRCDGEWCGLLRWGL